MPSQDTNIGQPTTKADLSITQPLIDAVIDDNFAADAEEWAAIEKVMQIIVSEVEAQEFQEEGELSHGLENQIITKYYLSPEYCNSKLLQNIKLIEEMEVGVAA